MSFCENENCTYAKTEAPTALKTCGGCKWARYCSPECQKTGWKQHKANCKPVRTTRSTRKVFQAMNQSMDETGSRLVMQANGRDVATFPAGFRIPFCFNDGCEYAHKKPPKTYSCGACPRRLRASYCSRKCQELCWPQHKKYCKIETLEGRMALDKELGYVGFDSSVDEERFAEFTARMDASASRRE